MGNQLKQINVNFIDGHSLDITNEVQRLLDGVKSGDGGYIEELKAVLHSNYRYLTPEAINAITDAYTKTTPKDCDDDSESDTVNESINLSEQANSNGVYSLYNGWVKRPEAENIPDDIDLGDQLDMWEYKCDQVNTVEEIDELLDDIYKMRYESLVNGGEYSVGNLVFKELRNHGKLKELKDKKIEIENDDMSLN